MIDHIEIKVKNLNLSFIFYKEILASIDYHLIKTRKENERVTAYGFGRDTRVYFWIAQGTQEIISKAHIAFAVNSQVMVDNFYKIALLNKAISNGEPGFRKHYNNHYYAAYIIDLDKNNMEVVCRL
ncbi:hypothetical protein [Acinetobacter rudis]|uniref:VOC domain-containing protein n=1 Tax=Acinetobacter rudis CIP 110305 TaxID=421052 RepID=S3PS39_9GAMM|nr:hypothetical protein [Acinetobacter rudis]EPF81576.1 hypothetical protein F945_00210 [Acinetobacter rudis CIP 110305]